MKRAARTTNADTMLLALIAAIWFIGVVLLPTIHLRAPAAFITGLASVYLALDAVTFLFSLWLLVKTMQIRASHGAGLRKILHALLYLYILAALATSATLMVHASYW
jgi:hypothetical protein